MRVSGGGSLGDMTEMTSGSVIIDAPHAKVEELLFDISSYPTWSATIKSVEVLQRDGSNKVTSAKLLVDAGMMKDRVTLEYDWTQAPKRLSFSMTDADLLTAMEGVYIISEVDEDTTEVTYQLHVDISMPIPAMMRQKAEKATIDASLSQLKSRAEE
jgi:ribosome-associated toxin RatA of RatAB toxin-antitoxin module